MNRHERRRAEKLGNDSRKRTSEVKLGIDGISALAGQLPDDRWYCLRIYFNRAGAVHFSEQVDPITGNPPR